MVSISRGNLNVFSWVGKEQLVTTMILESVWDVDLNGDL